MATFRHGVRSASLAAQRVTWRITSWLEKAQQAQPSGAPPCETCRATSTHPARRQRLGRQELEGVAHVHLVAARGVLGRRSPAPRCASPTSPTAAVAGYSSSSARKRSQEVEVLRLALVVEMVLAVVGVDRRRGLSRCAVPAGSGGLSAQLLVVEVEVDGVEAEAVDAALEPEPRDVEQRVLHLAVVEVEVRLLGQEVVQVVLPARACPTPRPSRRRSTASCWAACRRAWGRPRRTSRPWGCRGSTGSP